MNWGSVSINEDEGIMIVNDNRLPIISHLIERETLDAMSESGETHGGAAPMAGTPYGIQQDRFISPLGVPCDEPPYGTLSAVNLNTNEVEAPGRFGDHRIGPGVHGRRAGLRYPRAGRSHR